MNEREKFEKWWSQSGIEYASIFESSAARKGWQAALSTRKPYGYGIVDKTGDSVDVFFDKETAENRVNFLHSETDVYAPYRVVELFYEEDK